MKLCFVDTNFFISLHISLNSRHKDARVISEKLLEQSIEFVYSNYIFLEVATILSQRLGKKQTLPICKKLREQHDFNKIIHINESLQEQTWAVFSEFKNKDMSFVDASTLVVMQTYGIQHLASFDKDFLPFQKKFGFRVIV